MLPLCSVEKKKYIKPVKVPKRTNIELKISNGDCEKSITADCI